MGKNFSKAELVLTAGNISQLVRDGRPQIAFSGRSNVGKSSLINTLIGRKSLARVSQSPGKTITVNYYLIDDSFYLVDIPGYGYAKRSSEDKARWSSLVNGYFTKYGQNITAVAQLIDLKVGCTAEDLTMLDFMSKKDLSYFVVATKSDKLNVTERKKALARLAEQPCLENSDIIVFSALKKEGKDEVIQKILSLVTK